MSLTLDISKNEWPKRLKVYDAKSNAAILRVFLENALDLEKEAKNLAPKDAADLEGDIITNPKVKGAPNYESQVHAGTGRSAAYALRMHESLAPAIPTGDTQFKPGEVTRAKPPTQFGAAGGKYLERPLKGKGKQYMKRVADRMKGLK
jgi:hypothetical protein